MTIAQAIVLGIIQGLTEFLPISSSAHLVLVPKFFNWQNPTVTFDVFLHFATFLAVLSFFWKEVVQIIKAFFQTLLKRNLKIAQGKLAWLLLIGTIPAAGMGYFWGDFFENLFKNPLTVSYLLLITGILLWTCERKTQKNRKMENIGLMDSLVIGLAQGFAIAPGISRSGSTISAGVFLGLNREAAAKYSFLLSLPIILGTTIFEARNLPLDFSINLPLIFGFVFALISGYLGIKYLLKYLQRGNLNIFAYYCWSVGIISILLLKLKV